MEAKETCPSLLSQCIKATASTIAHGGCNYLQDVLELPFDLLETLVMELSPLALHALHEILQGNYSEEPVARDDSNTRKRGRYEIFDQAWERLFKKRWNEEFKREQINSGIPDWHQLYCEKHLNECFEQAIETALLPTFSGGIYELTVSDKIMMTISHDQKFTDDWKRLSYHCRRFGPHARYLRLQNVLCVQEMAELLIGCKLERLTFIRIIAQNQVDGACMLINQNRQTLHCVQFIRCQLHPGSMNQVYDSICTEGSTHGLQILNFISSRFFETTPPGLLSLLSSGRDFKSVCFRDTKLQQASAEAIFQTLLQSSCELHSFEMSDNYISTWLSDMSQNSNNFSSLPEPAICLNSISVLNLRSNNLDQNDAGDLCFLLQKMPNLTSLDLSDNTLTDEGIRYLIPFFVWAFGKVKPLSDLSLESCSITDKGFDELLKHCLPVFRESLSKLSLSDNRLGSTVAENMAKLMEESLVKELKIEDISLGESGFEKLRLHLPKQVSVSHINISKNRGKNEAAIFISEMISRAPHLVSINAAFNIMPPESFTVIFNALDMHFKERGKLELLDLTNNPQLFISETTSQITKFQHRGNPVVIFSRRPAHFQIMLHDDDP
ncbi:Ribonuclease inhibitor [Rhynchospora pubera]|uniref:Ribonuclease inhibitor n=1 Tax=Rhynchospora pubera TaxID=906938 RepID=A0AAV8EWB7_9POAL|nr:Ribonuclease inhibitor [Rhynchospora pubera]